MDCVLPLVCKNFGPVKYGDEQDKRLLHSCRFFYSPIIECEWVKGASVYCKGRFPLVSVHCNCD